MFSELLRVPAIINLRLVSKALILLLILSLREPEVDREWGDKKEERAVCVVFFLKVE